MDIGNVGGGFCVSRLFAVADEVLEVLYSAHPLAPVQRVDNFWEVDVVIPEMVVVVVVEEFELGVCKQDKLGNGWWCGAVVGRTEE
jgi:hypothetical protein